MRGQIRLDTYGRTLRGARTVPARRARRRGPRGVRAVLRQGVPGASRPREPQELLEPVFGRALDLSL